MQLSGPPQFAWRSAPQPDIVRAVQKDDLYLQQSVDACYDAVMRLFGAVPALQHSKSCKLVATFMYYALTTGAGLPTLGEEYCDILQLTTQRLPTIPVQHHHQHHHHHRHHQQQQQLILQGLAPGRTRVLLVLLQSLGPALLDRLLSSLDRAANSGDLPEDLTSFSSWQEYEQAAAGIQQQPDDLQAAAAAGSGGAGTLLQQLHRRWHQALQRLGPQWPAVKPWLLLLGKLHLAAFYLHGSYYEWSKRLLGVTYTSTSANREQRPSYRVLGLLLLVQLALSAGMQAKPQLEALHSQCGSRQQQQEGQERGQQHAAVLPDWCDYPEPGEAKGSSLLQPNPREQQHARTAAALHADGSFGSDGAGGAAAGLGSGINRQCPLCLSPRTHPTCTPCGHVFCWHCIAQWCMEKPECPLCRTGVVSSQLVCVYHSDF